MGFATRGAALMALIVLAGVGVWSLLVGEPARTRPAALSAIVLPLDPDEDPAAKSQSTGGESGRRNGAVDRRRDDPAGDKGDDGAGSAHGAKRRPAAPEVVDAPEPAVVESRQGNGDAGEADREDDAGNATVDDDAAGDDDDGRGDDDDEADDDRDDDDDD